MREGKSQQLWSGSGAGEDPTGGPPTSPFGAWSGLRRGESLEGMEEGEVVTRQRRGRKGCELYGSWYLGTRWTMHICTSGNTCPSPPSLKSGEPGLTFIDIDIDRLLNKGGSPAPSPLPLLPHTAAPVVPAPLW